MDSYDPYKIAQQQAYLQAQQQQQGWAGVAANPAGSYAAASAAPQTVQQPTTVYDPIQGANVQRRTNPNYGEVSTRPVKDGSAGTGIGNDNFTKFGKNWWGEIPQATFGEIINDPDKYSRMWADHFNLGENTEGIIQNFASMPVNYLYGMGLADQFTGPGVENPLQKQAALQDQLYDRILRGGHDGLGASYIDPKQLMHTALNAYVTKDADGNYIGTMNPLATQFGDPAQPPQAQVQNFMNYIHTTVSNLIPKASAQAYEGILKREGDLFQDYITKNPTVNVTFNKWIKDRLGPNGGL